MQPAEHVESPKKPEQVEIEIARTNHSNGEQATKIVIHGPSPKLATLNETVLQSLFRDFQMMGRRIRYVIIPFGSGSGLRSWDLWGPLVLCIWLSWTLSSVAPPATANAIFGTVFCLVWFGAAGITVNAKLLGGNVSFFHCVCTLGYSLFPMNVSAMLCIYLKAKLSFMTSCMVVLGAFLLSFKAAALYMEALIHSEKKGLSLYPIFLFYIYIAFFIIQMTQG